MCQASSSKKSKSANGKDGEPPVKEKGKSDKSENPKSSKSKSSSGEKSKSKSSGGSKERKSKGDKRKRGTTSGAESVKESSSKETVSMSVLFLYDKL